MTGRGGAIHEVLGGLMRGVLLVVLLGMFWLFAVSGLADMVLRSATGLLFPGAAASLPQASTVLSVDRGVQVAKQRLREVAPDVASATQNLDVPAVSQVGDETTYVWRYVSKSKSNTAVVRTFSLVLGRDGSVRHMGASK